MLQEMRMQEIQTKLPPKTKTRDRLQRARLDD